MKNDAWNQLEIRLRSLNVRESDITEQFVRSGGHGGQNVNKVSTCVILTHRPSGLSIRCEEERSQNRNRYLARLRLADRLESLERTRVREAKSAAERTRRQKRKRNKTSKERTLKHKHHRSEIKKSRQGRWGRDE